MGDRGAAKAEAPVFAETSKVADGLVGLPARRADCPGGAQVIDLDRSRRQEGDADREEHWEEVELVLEMWDRVARAWDNDTLVRLARYARLEAATERDLERKTR